ncbi:hypothetical protein JCM11641_004988 [Rhodosporidiobolus odoratus]
MNSPNLPSTPSAGLPAPVPGSGGLEDVTDPEEEELWSSRALLLVLLLLILSFWVSYYLKVRRIRSIHETIIAMFAGMFVGALVRLSPGHVVQSMIAFKSTILLNVLLPPIILNSGYGLRQENFFRNFAVILSFAFAGTFISAVAMGVTIYLYSLLGLEGLSLTMVECLLFGSTLSATDPVTILAIFNALHVDPKLYSIIFGESILNDAVAIVMFETLSQFHGTSLHFLSFFHGVGIFLLTFCISMALGVCFGLGCSLMLKHSELGRYTEIEACLVLLIAYTSYFFSNALTMSGIVSLLFCGITLKHYAYHNMSRRTQRTTRYLFGSLAQLSENFIFIYLGLSLFTQTQLVYKPMFIIVTFFAVCIARYCAVFPISKLINIVFRARGARTDEIPHSYRVMLFWAGLRGAVGVALAQGLKGEHAVTLQTTCLVAVVLTTMLFGGTIQRMIEILGIRTGMDNEEEGDSSGDEDVVAAGGGYSLAALGDPLDQVEGARRHSKRRSEPVNAYRGGGGAASGGSGGAGGRGRNARYASPARDFDRDRDAYDTSGTLSPHDSPYRDAPSTRQTHSRGSSRLNAPRFGSGTSVAGGRRSRTNSVPESDVEASSDESDELPPAAALVAGQEGLGEGLGRVWRDGQWFQVLDEKFLIPVFSNATASRKSASKKALRAKRNSFVAGEGGSPGDDADERIAYLGGNAAGNKSFTLGRSSSSSAVSPFPASSSSLAASPLPASSFASPNSPMPSVDVSTAAVSSTSTSTPAESRAFARARSGGLPTSTPSGSGVLPTSHTTTAGGFGGTGTSVPVMPFGSGRRSSTAFPSVGSGHGGSPGGSASPKPGYEEVER